MTEELELGLFVASNLAFLAFSRGNDEVLRCEPHRVGALAEYSVASMWLEYSASSIKWLFLAVPL